MLFRSSPFGPLDGEGLGLRVKIKRGLMRFRHLANDMRKRQVWVLALLFCLVIKHASIGSSYPTGISDVEHGCTCHNAVPTASVNITFEGVPVTYQANTTYTLNISAAGGAQSVENHTNYGGFNLWVSHGVLSNLSDEVQVFENGEKNRRVGAKNSNKIGRAHV